MLTNLEIARKVKPYKISKIAKSIGIKENELELYGNYKAKIDLSILKRIKNRQLGKYVLVTAITPTPLGEGKTISTIGLSMALNSIGKKTIACLRQPSLGPVFGIKGGASGGGYSQIIPMEDINLHFTGDIHAVGLANNLAAAHLDNTLCKGNPLQIKPESITLRRVVDVSDRFLRNITVGLGGKDGGCPRDTGFDITVASEVMAILALTTSLQDLRKRLGRMVVAEDVNGKPVTLEDLKVAGSMCVLLKDAIKPNLIQTMEHTPVLMHAGPFGNIAHGNSSILADQIALRLADFVVTEAGFGTDLGAEKFFDIKCRYSGLKPDAVVMVATIRALKMHSGKFNVVAGKPLDKGLISEDLRAIEEGICNLEKQIENVRLFGLPCIVALNRFKTDTDKEVALVRKRAIAAGATDCLVSEVWAKGGKGAIELAKAVVSATKEKNHFKFLYPLDIPIKDKIKAIATQVYGAKDVSYEPIAEEKLAKYTARGYGNLPICMAKTHLSLSHDPTLKGRPRDFILPVRDVRASVGAGFIYPLCGKMQTMPGLPSQPALLRIDIDKKGNIVGLS
ncbi:MAG TPA: formate--tetrahydrofolate ligase [Candidatus Omnitrophica bacterium]|nr:formate--tetrahydrofolate ligase [Candidatus Omnitrophota bacterium]HBG63062.1 formate--tetrahydrofolate ligase [Candidatus Omnitrophota bacterium]